jgi:hypothetical protein
MSLFKSNIVTINGTQYNVEHKEWRTHKGEYASGFSCQVDPQTNLGRPTMSEMIEAIINHQPSTDDGAKEWYGNSRYMGD